MTPRMMSAWLFIRAKLRTGENITKLGITALGSSGDGQTVNRQIEDWERQLR